MFPLCKEPQRKTVQFCTVLACQEGETEFSETSVVPLPKTRLFAGGLNSRFCELEQEGKAEYDYARIGKDEVSGA